LVSGIQIQQQQTELEAKLKGKQEEVMGLAQKFEPISDRLQQVEHAARQWQAALKENRVP
jgi:chromosome segregation ATPase